MAALKSRFSHSGRKATEGLESGERISSLRLGIARSKDGKIPLSTNHKINLMLLLIAMFTVLVVATIVWANYDK